MASKTYLTKVTDVEPEDGIIVLPQNRTLYADQFTNDAPNSDDEREPFKPKSMKEVFEHYHPEMNLEMITEDGGSLYETLNFKEIKDFDDDQLIAHSDHLSAEKAKVDVYNSVIRQLQKNKTLRNTLRDESTRGSLKDALRALIAELEDADN